MSSLITSLHHPLVKHLIRIKQDPSYRYEHRTLLLEGMKPIVEICQKHEAVTILIEEKLSLPTSLLSKRIIRVPKRVIEKISSMKNPEGILAEVSLPPELSLRGPKNYLLALDGIADPGNLGTLVRTGLALGWDGVLLLNHCVDPFNDKAIRAARGALFKLPLYQATWEEVESLALSNQLPILMADLKGEPIQTFSPTRCLLVLGNEAHGPSSQISRLAHKKISIPMIGPMESLNVSIAGAILMHALKSR